MITGCCAAVLLGKPTPEEGELSPIADSCSQSERRAADARQELVEWKKVRVHGRAGGRVSMR